MLYDFAAEWLSSSFLVFLLQQSGQKDKIVALFGVQRKLGNGFGSKKLKGFDLVLASVGLECEV
ncbi:hypothetical protein D3C86_1417490 [compost metagenome]